MFRPERPPFFGYFSPSYLISHSMRSHREQALPDDEDLTPVPLDRIIDRAKECMNFAANVGRATVLFIRDPDALAEIMARHEPVPPDDAMDALSPNTEGY